MHTHTHTHSLSLFRVRHGFPKSQDPNCSSAISSHKQGACELRAVPSVATDSLSTFWTVARQAPQSVGFSRQEYWSGLPCPPPGHLPNPGMKPVSLASPAWTGRFFATWEAPSKVQGIPKGSSNIYSTGQHHRTLCEDSHLTCRLILRSACKAIRVTCL